MSRSGYRDIGTSGHLKSSFSAPPRLRGEIFFNIFRTIHATLREIFDESAYDRFLQRTGTSHCKDSYRAFMRDRESAMAQKPRCC